MRLVRGLRAERCCRNCGRSVWPRVALPVRVGRKSARLICNHRKIVVIDGEIGYTGSQNMVSADFKPGLNYSELMVRIKGRRLCNCRPCSVPIGSWKAASSLARRRFRCQ